jgi:hypothetical protein
VNPSEVRRNQHLLAEVNQRIARVTGERDERTSAFLCECGQEDCNATVAVDLEEYGRLRAQDDLFLVASGHCVDGVDRLM